MKCGYCGASNSEYARFCLNCSTPMLNTKPKTFEVYDAYDSDAITSVKTKKSRVKKLFIKDKKSTETKTLGFLGWCITIILLFIPYVNFVSLLLWAIFSKYKERKYLSRSLLIFTLLIGLTFPLWGTDSSSPIGTLNTSNETNTGSSNDSNNTLTKKDDNSKTPLFSISIGLDYRGEIPKTESELPDYLFKEYTTLVSHTESLERVGESINQGNLTYRESVNTINMYLAFLEGNLDALRSIDRESLAIKNNIALLDQLILTYEQVISDTKYALKSQDTTILYNYGNRIDQKLLVIEKLLKDK